MGNPITWYFRETVMSTQEDVTRWVLEIIYRNQVSGDESLNAEDLQTILDTNEEKISIALETLVKKNYLQREKEVIKLSAHGLSVMNQREFSFCPICNVVYGLTTG
jgi:hypothetical protein